MKITNRSPGPRGFFAKDNPLVPVVIKPGESAEVEGFNDKLPSHAAMIEAGHIVVENVSKAATTDGKPKS